MLIALLGFTFLGKTHAQVELKINPLRILLFNSADIVGEYAINEDFGVELGFGLRYGTYGELLDQELDRSGFRFLAAGKYYFGPKEGTDRFYAGVYLRPKSVTFEDNDGNDFDSGFKQSSIGVGLMLGYKWVGARGITLEVGGGLGRGVNKKTTLNNNDNTINIPSLNIDGLLRLAVGYRFGGNS